MCCTFGRLDEFKWRILVILPPKIAKSRAIIHDKHTVLLNGILAVTIYQMDTTIQILL